MPLTMNGGRRTCDSLIRFDLQMRKLQYHLQCLERDFALMDAGWTIIYAVDWCELHRYAFGVAQLMGRTGPNGLTRRQKRDFVDKAGAIRYMINGIHENARAVLLPPYACELNMYLEDIRGRALHEEMQLEKLRWVIERDSELLAALREVARRRAAEPDKPIPRVLIQTAYKRLSAEFRDLLLLRLAVADHGVEALRRLLTGDGKKMRFLDEVREDIGGYLRSIDQAQVIGSVWFRQFQRLRCRWTSDFYDAYAMEILETLNRNLESDKVLFTVVSDAPTMALVLNWDLLEIDMGNSTDVARGVVGEESEAGALLHGEYRLLRTPRTFLMLLLQMEGGRPPIEGIRSHLGKLSDYFGLASGVVRYIKQSCPARHGSAGESAGDASCTTCPYATGEVDIHGMIGKYERLADEYEAVQLFLSQEAVFDTWEVWERGRMEKLFGEELLNVVMEFAEAGLGKDARFGGALRERRRQLDEKLEALKNDVASVTVTGGPAAGLSGLGYSFEKFLRVAGRVGFTKDRIRPLLMELEGAVLEGRVTEEVRRGMGKLLALTKDQTLGHEGPLLQAVLAYVCSEIEFCRYICEREAQSLASEDAFGFRYLLVLAMHSIGTKNRDQRLVVRGLEMARELTCAKPDDARVWHLLGLLRLRAKRSGLVDELDLKGILAPLERARAMAGGTELEVTVINNELYATVVLGERTEATRSRILTLLQDMSGRHAEWAAFLDTEGCALSWLSEGETAVEKRIDLLRKAVSKHRQAIELAKLRGAGLDDTAVYEEHLRLTLETLRRVGGDDAVNGIE